MLNIKERPAACGTPHRLPGTPCHRHHRPIPARAAAAAHRSHDCVSDSVNRECIENIPWRWTKPGAGAPRATFPRWSVGTSKNRFPAYCWRDGAGRAPKNNRHRGHGPLPQRTRQSAGASRGVTTIERVRQNHIPSATGILSPVDAFPRPCVSYTTLKAGN